MVNKDILSIIFKYLDLRILGKLKQKLDEKFFPKHIENRLKYYKNRSENLKCTVCKNHLTFHNFDICENGYRKIAEDSLFCISMHDCDEEYYICTNWECRTYYLCCPKCSTEDEKILCQFCGFSGFHYDDSRHFRVTNKYLISEILKEFPFLKEDIYFEKNKKNKKNILSFSESDGDGIDKNFCEKIDKIIDKAWDKRIIEFCREVFAYDVRDLNLEYFRTYIDEDWEWLPTGSSGGYCHFWKCKNCKKVFEDTDK